MIRPLTPQDLSKLVRDGLVVLPAREPTAFEKKLAKMKGKK